LVALSIIVPCLNEAASLPELVARVHEAFGDPGLAGVAGELVLVDDGSSDGTLACIERLRAEFPGLKAERHDRPRGIPAAWRTGLSAARGDVVCAIDADLQYQPEDIPRLWHRLAAGDADIVQGVRAGNARARDARLLLSRGLSRVLNLVFGMSLRDNKSGFFVCRREVLAALLDHRGRYRHWQCFVMVAAHHRGYRISEIDTTFLPRRAGRSAFGEVPLAASLAVLRDLATAWREYGGARR
jgi:phenylacetate-CoA ligase